MVMPLKNEQILKFVMSVLASVCFFVNMNVIVVPILKGPICDFFAQ